MKRSAFNSLTALILVALFVVIQSCNTSDDPTIGTPTVNSFTSYTDEGISNGGHVGSVIKISGTYFSEKGTNTVKFNGTEATVITEKTSATSLSVIVPAGASTGKVSVTVGDHTGTSTIDFTVSAGTPAPVIMGFSWDIGSGALAGVDQDSVVISGYNFSTNAANNVVTINGITAVSSAKPTATSIKVGVPFGATDGKVEVSVDGVTGTATSDADFKVPSPTISGFTPSGSIVGSTVVITGTNFSKVADNNVVKFNGTSVTTLEVNDKGNTLTVIVPNGASDGKITVQVDGVTGTSSDSFNVN